MNPFTDDVHSCAADRSPDYDSVYEAERSQLSETVSSLRALPASPGKTVLLISSRAGAGKSHFLDRWTLQEGPEEAHLRPISLRDPEDLHWPHWLRQLVIGSHADPRLEHVFTQHVARLFGKAACHLIENGHTEDASGSSFPDWFAADGAHLFSTQSQSHSAVRWFHDCYPTLLPLIVGHYESTLALADNELRPWLSFFYQYGLTGLRGTSSQQSDQSRAHYLRHAEILQSSNHERSRSQVTIASRLLAASAPLVFVLDDLDWVYRDRSAALKLSCQVLELSKLVPASLVMVSVNQDVWDETFVPGLPQAMRDRLTQHTLRLEGVPRSDWAPFLATRAGTSLTNEQIASMEGLLGELRERHPNETTLTPRQLFRAAAQWWQNGRLATEAAAPPQLAAPRVQPQVVDSPASPPLESTQRLADAMGDLRSLIQARQSRPVTAPSPNEVADTSNSSDELSSPTETGEKNPIIIPELKAFVAEFGGQDESKSASQTAEAPQAPSAAEAPRLQPLAPSTVSSAAHNPSHDSPPSLAQNGRSTVSVPPTRDAVRTRLRLIKIALSKQPPAIDLALLRHVLVTAGDTFPALLQDQATASAESSRDEMRELRWRFQQSEIHFGFHDYADTGYWRQLLTTTANRAQELRAHDRTRVKLAVFGRRGDERLFEAWNQSDEDTAHLEFCDAIILTDQQIMSINAMGHFLAHDVHPTQRQTAFSHASEELEFFWKMITRPVWNLVSQANRSSL